MFLFLLTFFSCPKISNLDTVLCSKPQQVAHWQAPPVIRICSSNPQTWTRVDKALDFWRKMGHVFGTVVYADMSDWCLGNQSIFAIVIKEGDFFDPATRGKTTTRYTGSLMYAAEIVIKYGHINSDLMILEHEIGHALGYKHIPSVGHLMHPITNKM